MKSTLLFLLARVFLFSGIAFSHPAGVRTDFHLICSSLLRAFHKDAIRDAMSSFRAELEKSQVPSREQVDGLVLLLKSDNRFMEAAWVLRAAGREQEGLAELNRIEKGLEHPKILRRDIVASGT